MPPPRPRDRTITVATWGGPYEHSQEKAYFEPFHAEDGHPDQDRTIQRRTCRASAAGEPRRDRLGRRGHDHGRQPRRLQPGTAGDHRSLDAPPRARRHAGRRGLRRWRADRVRGLANRVCHGDGVQPRRVPRRAPGAGEGPLRPPAIPREEGIAEAPRGESRMGAQVVRGAARGPLPVAEHGAGSAARVREARRDSRPRCLVDDPWTSRWSCS